jgi:potassium-transporting ATPase potassium-binding subunit
MARVYQKNRLGPIERHCYRLCGVDPDRSMDWKQYLTAMLLLNALGFLFTYGIQRLQEYLPFNPQGFSGVSPLIAFNTAASFISNTNWQAYAGENSLSYLTQATALSVQNFISAASGMALLMAVVRGLTAQEEDRLGNFWVDTLRGILYILLPLSCLLAVFLVSTGTIQNLKPYQSIQTLESQAALIPMGPVASQAAIKILGTNGGGFFNTNAAHPFENPSPLSGFGQLIGLMLIPAALCITFGKMVNDRRQGWAILSTMLIFTVPLVFCSVAAEYQNFEGKETRFGITQSAVWASVATATDNGSVNAALDSFMPLGGLIPLWLIQLGKVFGGVGSGLYGMLVMVIITVFVAGLMVGRTPEYLGKKIEPYDLKMASLAILIPPLLILPMTAAAILNTEALKALSTTGPHGFTQALYAFSSMVNNNGSAFAGLQADNPFYALAGGICMLLGRYAVVIPILALAGSLAKKKKMAQSAGTLLTHTPLFVGLLAAVILLLGALSFFPALALGPIVEYLLLWSGHVA